MIRALLVDDDHRPCEALHVASEAGGYEELTSEFPCNDVGL